MWKDKIILPRYDTNNLVGTGAYSKTQSTSSGTQILQKIVQKENQGLELKKGSHLQTGNYLQVGQNSIYLELKYKFQRLNSLAESPLGMQKISKDTGIILSSSQLNFQLLIQTNEALIVYVFFRCYFQSVLQIIVDTKLQSLCGLSMNVQKKNYFRQRSFISQQIVRIMANNYDFMFKFIIIGDSSVGKSCLLLRFTEERFKSDHEPTLGVEFGSKTMEISNRKVKIQIWDTAGQQSFKSITRSYYKSSIAALLVFDITKRESFQNLNKWLFEIKNNSHDKIQAVVIGNKSDLKDNRQVSFQDAEKFATDHGFNYYQTSARHGNKVQDVFISMAEKVMKIIDDREINPDSYASYGIKIGKDKKTIPRPGPTILDPKPDNNNRPNKKCCGG